MMRVDINSLICIMNYIIGIFNIRFIGDITIIMGRKTNITNNKVLNHFVYPEVEYLFLFLNISLMMIDFLEITLFFTIVS